MGELLMPVLLDDGGTVDNPLQMITREEWGAAARRGSPFHGFRTNYEALVGHHTAGSFPESGAAEEAVLRGIQDFHMNGEGWTDIAYNHGVAPSGRLYELRGFQYRNGANSGKSPETGASANRATLSIVYLGNTERHPFTVEAANTISRFREYLELPVSACPGGCGLWGHRDVNPTTCPGSKDVPVDQGRSEEAMLNTGKIQVVNPATDALVSVDPVKDAALLEAWEKHRSAFHNQRVANKVRDLGQ